MAATVTDVARLAGVSTATVTRTLAGYAHVTARTRERVMKAVDTLGYAPNQNARSLRTLRTQRLIVTVPDISNIFFSSIILGAEAAAQAAGYTILLGDVSLASDSGDKYGQMLHRKEADGLIFLGHTLPPSLRSLIARDPLAPVVNGCEFSPSLGVSSVHIDNAAAAAEAMDHLYELGHRRVGVIMGAPENPINRDRLAGVRSSAEAHGLSAALRIRDGDFSVESGARLAQELLGDSERPTALFCFSDDLAIGALHTVRETGLSCPGDISVAGFDDIRVSAFIDPPLTTVRQPMRDIGGKAVRLLLDIIEGRATSLINLTLPHELVLRASTGPAPSY